VPAAADHARAWSLVDQIVWHLERGGDVTGDSVGDYGAARNLSMRHVLPDLLYQVEVGPDVDRVRAANIQSPPVRLMADHQTAGSYPVVAGVAWRELRRCRRGSTCAFGGRPWRALS